jgi:pimeloyl-ACP methyl ester carboxylesterase
MKIALAIILWVFLSTRWAASGIPIDTAYAANIGGIWQWVWLRGDDRSAPLMLFLHGGPGNSVMKNARRFTEQLEKKFLVVHWDQRGSGRTQELNPSTGAITLDLAAKDVAEMIDYLRAQFKTEKVYLMGHSWGGFLALLTASQLPHLVEACFAISPMVDQLESERRALEWMSLQAQSTGHEDALDDLGTIRIPFASGEQLFAHRRWLSYFSGTTPPSRTFVIKWSDQWLSLFNEGAAVNLTEIAPAFRCPIYFVLGGGDRQTDSRIAQEYYQKLTAPAKDLLLILDSRHNPHTDEPARFQEWVLRKASGG